MGWQTLVPFTGNVGSCPPVSHSYSAALSLPQQQTALRQDSAVELDAGDSDPSNLVNSPEMNPSTSTEKRGPRMYPSHAAFSDLAQDNGVTTFSMAQDSLVTSLWAERTLPLGPGDISMEI